MEDDDEIADHDVVIRRRCESRRTVSNFLRKATRHCKYPTLTFKDVEDTLETFSGDSGENVRQWINSFEEIADMYEWIEVQKVI